MKRIIRLEKKKIRESLSKAEIKKCSEDLLDIFFDSPLYKEAKVIMSYMSIKNEIDTFSLNEKIIKDNKELLLPVIEEDDIKAIKVDDLSLCQKGKYNILEPEERIEWKQKIDLIVVPGVAFDKFGTRVGFGKGYYDRFLIGHRTSIKIGFLYEFQLLDTIEGESHDIKMDFLLSNEGWIK